jgi:hypothetical protein
MKPSMSLSPSSSRQRKVKVTVFLLVVLFPSLSDSTICGPRNRRNSHQTSEHLREWPSHPDCFALIGSHSFSDFIGRFFRGLEPAHFVTSSFRMKSTPSATSIQRPLVGCHRISWFANWSLFLS